jgi:hypothetical protein
LGYDQNEIQARQLYQLTGHDLLLFSERSAKNTKIGALNIMRLALKPQMQADAVKQPKRR